MAIELTARHTTNEGPDSDSDDNASVLSASSDTSSEMTELEQDEFPRYFSERNGRLFHRHGNSPYPLPVDAAEQQRTNGQHMLLYELRGKHCSGPVRHVLREGGRALDLCTGTGQWVLDMAHEFPAVRFYGLDIVPIATRYPPDNVLFEMADVNEPLRHRASRFNLVHARSVSMAVTNYPALLNEVARVLRPGGLFVAGEWGRSAALNDNRDPRNTIPRTVAFYTAVRQELQARSIHPAIYDNLERWLADSGHFERVRVRVHQMPVGDWPMDGRLRALGIEFRNMLELYATSMKVMLVEAGHPGADALVSGFLEEVHTVRGMVCRFKTVHGRRRRSNINR